MDIIVSAAEQKKTGNWLPVNEAEFQLYTRIYTPDMDAFLQEKPDVVLEAANPAVVRACAKKILRSGADFIPMSVGGLIDPGFIEKMEAAAEVGESNLIVLAGAMTGQNICAAGALPGLEEVVIQSTKGVKGLITAPYIVNNSIDLESLTEPMVVYRNNVFDAVKNFPQNVNVAASLALVVKRPWWRSYVIRILPRSVRRSLSAVPSAKWR